ncbi:MAG: hypothetical protein ABSD75_10815 [Terriglobales bacterium]|jgi:hypothetical protein
MQPEFAFKPCLFALTTCLAFLCSPAAAQNAAPSLLEQLKAQYNAAKIGADAGGLKVVNPGTVLTVQKGGLLGIAPQIAMFCPSKFQDGELKAPAGLCAAMVKQGSRFLQVGTKVYPLKIDVSLDKDRVSLQVIECDSCNGVQQPSFYKSEVVFQFAKGSLQSTGASQVEDTIGQVLVIDSGGDSPSGDNQSSQNQDSNQGGGGGGSGGAGQAQPTAPPAEPQQIEKGQTIDQVKAALGNPDKIVNLGAKQIYLYKDLKVTFLNGKVSDVE